MRSRCCAVTASRSRSRFQTTTGAGNTGRRSMYQGTRETKSFFTSDPASREDNGFYTRDKGLSKRVITTATFGSNTIFDAGATYTVFKVGDLIQITGTAGGLNNGDRTVLAVTASQLTVDLPVHTEGPTAGVEIRTQ